MDGTTMKRFLLLMLAASSLVACSSCVKKNADPVVVDGSTPAPSTSSTAPPAQVTMTVTGPHWELTLPSKAWSLVVDDIPPNTVVLVNLEQQNVVVVEDKPNTDTLEAFTLSSLRDLREAGATVVSAKQVTVNGHNFVLIDTFKGDDAALIWVTVNGTRSVGFQCGGGNKVDQASLCKGLFGALKLKD